MARHGVAIDRSEEWAELRDRHLKPADERPSSSARGVHHLALLSSDVGRLEIIKDPLREMYGTTVA